MKKLRLLGTVYLILIFTAGISSRIEATTIDFESMPAGNCAFIGSSVTTQGFLFTKGPTTTGFWSCDPSTAIIKTGDNPTHALINANVISNPTMENASGAIFSLLSFDAGSRMYPVDYRSESVLITGVKNDGNIISTKKFIQWNYFRYIYIAIKFHKLDFSLVACRNLAHTR